MITQHVDVIRYDCPEIDAEVRGLLIKDINKQFKVGNWVKERIHDHGYTSMNDILFIPGYHWTMVRESIIRAADKIVNPLPKKHRINGWARMSVPGQPSMLSWHTHNAYDFNSMSDMPNSISGVMYLCLPSDSSGFKSATTEFMLNDGSVYIPPPVLGSWFLYDGVRIPHRPGQWNYNSVEENRYMLAVDLFY